MLNSSAFETLLEMLQKYSKDVSYVDLPAWVNDSTKLNEVNMNELRNAINALQNLDILVSNGTIKTLCQLLDEMVGKKVLGEGYTQGVTITGVNNDLPLSMSKPGTPEIFNDYENNEAVSPYSHAEGYSTHAGECCAVNGLEVEQYLENTTNNPENGVDRGVDTTGLKGLAAHSEGAHTCSEEDFAHAEGLASESTGIGAHAEGCAEFKPTGIKLSGIENGGLTLIVSPTISKPTLISGDIIRVVGYHVIVSEVVSEHLTVDTDEGPETKTIYKINLKYPYCGTIDTETLPEVYIVDFHTRTIAAGDASHAEGQNTTAIGRSSHSEGYGSTADGDHSHSEGNGTNSVGAASHAEGMGSVSEGEASHSEGCGTEAFGIASHTEGYETVAIADSQHVEGKYNIPDDERKYAHIIGNGKSDSERSNAHTVDWSGNSWYAGNVTVPEGKDFKVGNTALLQSLKKEQKERKEEDLNLDNKITQERTDRKNADKELEQKLVGSIEDDYSKDTIGAVKKKLNDIISDWILDETNTTNPDAIDKLQELLDWADRNRDGVVDIVLEMVGRFNRDDNGNTLGEIFNDYEHNEATGEYSHAEGYSNQASGNRSHAEGYCTEASGTVSHAEGDHTQAQGPRSHAEGYMTIATGNNSHTEGYYTEANGMDSHAEGNHTYANAAGSHSEGLGTVASSSYQHVHGKYNVEDNTDTYAHIVGGGSDENNRKNIHTLDWEGNSCYAGDVYVRGNKKLPVIFHGTSMPDNDLGQDGDIYIMFTTTEE